MRYTFISAAVLALTSSVFAQSPTEGFDVLTSPTEGQKVVAGSPFEIKWVPGEKPEYKNGTATIVLLQGTTDKDLQVGPLIVAGVKNSDGKYTWAVPSTAVGFAIYGLRITLDDDASTAAKEDTIFQYSFPFAIVADAGAETGTTTIRLGTGTAYTPPAATPTTTSTSVLSITNTTTATQTTVSVLPTNSSNLTATTSDSSATGSLTRTTRVPTPTASRPAEQTANAGVAKAVTGGFALFGGLVMAFAL